MDGKSRAETRRTQRGREKQFFSARFARLREKVPMPAFVGGQGGRARRTKDKLAFARRCGKG